MDIEDLSKLAPPGVTVLILFLAFSSQWLFCYIEPGPVRKGDAYIFDTLIVCILICYWRTCLTDPGRIPRDWQLRTKQHAVVSTENMTHNQAVLSNRWCRRCEALKPPRAHHCKTCKRCVVKMDHHCVWTANCISHVTIPHFIRFLSYAVVSMIYLEYLIYIRGKVLWDKRNLPSYLGPSVLQLAHLFILFAVNSFVLFALIVLLGRTLWSLAINTWTIESWEIERHHTLLRRARVLGGYIPGPDGTKVYIEHQEFPWDVGIWTNICQGMGTWNVLAWFWPFAASPSVESGLTFEHNEIDDPNKPWPPPDPDRLYRASRRQLDGDGFTQPMDVASFRERQVADVARYADADGEYVVRRQPFHERLDRARRQNRGSSGSDHNDPDDFRGGQDDSSSRQDMDGEEGWRNKEGERLGDFGVDEVADFYDEDEIPLAKLISLRKGA